MKGGSVPRRTRDEGFAMMFVLFLVALVVIGSSVAVLDTLTEGRREREAEMIWRGKQYQRAIGMYYRKFGRFPTSLDDLVKEQDGEIRFLREAYKNPMNNTDGSWRFIYVTPAGQLIGSVQYVSLQQMAFLDQQRQMGLTTGAAPGVTGGTNADNSGNDAGTQGGNNSALTNIPLGSISAGGSVNLNNLSPSQLQALQSQLQGLSSQQLQALAAQFQGQIPAQLQSQLQQMLQQQGQNPQQSGGSSSFGQQAQGQPGGNGGIGVQESSDSDNSTDANGQVIGGFIVGVAGKQNKASIKVYKGGATYKRWEFIFNPLEQTQTIGTAPVGATNPAAASANGQPQTPNQPPQQPQIPQQPQ
ncbi:MAG: hypothetical protein WA185_05820 [Candidatus Acidiferrales bacterium]